MSLRISANLSPLQSPRSAIFVSIRLDAPIYLRYGKGRHPAALNLGDCFSYAVTRLADQRLLCVGAVFPQTDLALA